MKNNKSRGFTLLEMSVVLVIIATIVAAIMLGRNLLITSRLQQIITDEDSYVTAIKNFQQAYQALPGDFPGAVTLWGAAAGNSSDNYTASCYGTQGTGTQTCNGNGNGEIGDNTYETFIFWQHLYGAGMFSQALSGVPGSGGAIDSIPGTNVPAGPIKGSGFSIRWVGVQSSNGTWFSGSYGNVIKFGSYFSSSMTQGPILTTEQAAAIDSKIDDGLASSGNVRTYENSNSYDPYCATSATAPSTYNVASTSSGPLCNLVFITGF